MKAILLFLIFIHPDTHAYEQQIATVRQREKFGNKFFIANRLKDIFGPDSEDLITKNILLSHNDLGGPCDLYEQEYKSPHEVVDTKAKCLRGKLGTMAPLSGKNTVVRTSLIAKTCMSLVNNDKTLRFLEKSLRDRNKINDSIHHLFYPLNDDQKREDHFLDHFKDSTSEKIKRTTLYYCLTKPWQTL
jgi:hypothetical protein